MRFVGAIFNPFQLSQRQTHSHSPKASPKHFLICAQTHLTLSAQVRKGLIYCPVVSYHKMATCKQLTARTPSPDFSYFCRLGMLLWGLAGRMGISFKGPQPSQFLRAQSHLAVRTLRLNGVFATFGEKMKWAVKWQIWEPLLALLHSEVIGKGGTKRGIRREK